MDVKTSRVSSKKRDSVEDAFGLPASKRKKTADVSKCKQTEAQSPADKFMKDVNIFILQAGLGKMRANILSKQFTKYGGTIHEQILDETTHVVVDEKMEIDRFCRILKLDTPPTHLKIVKGNWLSNCFAEEKLVDTCDFELDVNTDAKLEKDERQSKEKLPADVTRGINEQPGGHSKSDVVVADEIHPCSSKTDSSYHTEAKSNQSKGYDSEDSAYEPSDDEDYLSSFTDGPTSGTSSATSTPNTSPQKLPKGNWVCAKPVSNLGTNHNKHITDKLQILMQTYKNTKDQWRALGYSKAISALKNYHKAITTWEEANSIPGIGKKMADKVWEIIESGHLRKIDYVCQGEEVKAINLFTKIHGVGPTIAQELYQQGFRTIDDVREKAKLNRQQKIGIKHFDDFLDRMSREEAGEIEKVVKDMALSINPGLIAMACGSYRRGKPTCGDVDVIVTHPDGRSHKGIFHKLLEKLRATGFITDDLVSNEDVGEQKKYLGVCKLPGEDRKHRRLDIIVVPYHEYPCAIMYFTGSSHFNRSMRALAGKKGMSLNEHAMKSGVIRKGHEKISEGVSIPVKSEEDVFRILGLEYRTPKERDW
ncbi:DNA polymerase lambda-like [Saccoglossus kowalevskii]|uniref:DNA polymerase lambda n=1 Tax=Saccoglossus kowalevskii TaxID=10224 RepID=A0ABM0GNR7_SACKO|nr:PREDICTED: DNA polymerase lambda-like [Saccoglossus kowalevskii]